MKTTLLVLLFFTAFFVRALRWLAVMQQKEYRFDRVWLFLRSKEGVKEVFRILPKKTDFSRSGLKRPKLTYRSLLLVGFFCVLSILFFKLTFKLGLMVLLRWYPYPFWYKAVLLLIVMIVYLVLIPVLAMLSSVPTGIFASVQTYKRLSQAKKLLQEKNPTVIGITGSYGKTSTKTILAHVLRKKYSVFMTPKSYNTKYSVAQSVVTGYKGENIAVIEYAAYKKGEIKVLASWIKPDMAVITGLAKQHVGLFGSLEKIIAAKAELVACLPENALVVCNAYDDQTKQIYEAGSKENHAKLLAVGPNYKPVQLTKAKITNDGKLLFTWDGEVVHTQLIGLQYLEILHTVIVVALQFKLTKNEIVAALESFSPDDKFIVTYTLPSGTKVFDDGDTSNPKGFAAMIELAKSLKAKKKVLITPGIVDLGKDSKEVHAQLALVCQKVFDQVVFVGDSGQDEFRKVFGGTLLTTSQQLQEVISTLDDSDVIVIEGRMPAWTRRYLK